MKNRVLIVNRINKDKWHLEDLEAAQNFLKFVLGDIEEQVWRTAANDFIVYEYIPDPNDITNDLIKMQYPGAKLLGLQP